MKKRILIVSGVVVLVLVVAAAAFVGGQLLNGQGLPAGASSDGSKMMLSTNGPGGKGNVSFQLQPAKELPQVPADAQGIFDHRQDNRIFVGTGNVRMAVMKDQSGNVTTSASHTGPTVEVIVSPRTTVYRDVTLKQFNGEPPSGMNTVQQVVETGSLDEVGQNSNITAWGKKTGDRIDADVLVYTPSPVLQAR